MRLGLLTVGLSLCIGCAGTTTEEGGTECTADTDCDPAQICGEAGVHDPEAGQCLWVTGRLFHVLFISAEVTGGGSEDGGGTTWDLVGASNGNPDLKAGASQGLGDRMDCTGAGSESFSVTFADATDNPAVESNCMFNVQPGQPLTLYLMDNDTPGDGGGEDDIIDSWTWEGEESYAELLREPATKRLEGTWSSMFITVYDL
ncbi:MAG: hypothetical protein KC912_24360 [Proteobacteria bacterium]|nr:hypothetical protein [Pseudomonadota bacterium]